MAFRGGTSQRDHEGGKVALCLPLTPQLPEQEKLHREEAALGSEVLQGGKRQACVSSDTFLAILAGVL